MPKQVSSKNTGETCLVQNASNATELNEFKQKQIAYVGNAELEIYQNNEALTFDNPNEDPIKKYAYLEQRQFSSSEPTFANNALSIDYLEDATEPIEVQATSKKKFMHLKL